MSFHTAYFQLLRALNDQFSLTNDYYYLNTAKSLTAGMMASNPPDELLPVLQLVLLGIVEGGSMSIVLEHIEQVIEGVVSPMLADCLDRGGRLLTLSTLFHRRFHNFGVLDDLEKAITLGKVNVAEMPQDHLRRAESLNILGFHTSSRFDALGNLEDLHTAIERNQQAVEVSCEDQIVLADILDDLSIHLNYRFELLGDIDDLENAIRAAEEAVVVAPPEDPERAGKLSTLAHELLSRFQRVGSLEDIQKAIHLGEAAVAQTTIDDSRRARRLCHLGSYYATRFERLGRLEDLEKAIEIIEEEIASTPAEDAARAMRLCNLSKSLHSRFQRLGDVNDIEKSIRASEEAVEVVLPDCTDLDEILITLSMVLNCRFHRFGDPDDLANAIRVNEEAIVATPQDDPNRYDKLITLANNYHCQYELLGSIDDLGNAIRTSQEALAATPLHHPDRAISLNNLGLCLSSRFTRLGSLEDLENAILAGKEAVESTPKNHPDRTYRLINLGQWLGNRFSRYGDLNDLENAIRATEEGITITAPDNPRYVTDLSNLSTLFLSRFERLGSMDDLEKAIRLGGDGLAKIPQDHPDRAWMLNNLGIMLKYRYQRSGALQDLENAIQSTEEGLAGTPSADPYRVSMLGHLSDLLHTRYLGFGTIDDLTRALRVCTEAVTATPDDSPRLPDMFERLSYCYRSGYDLMGDRDHLETAIHASEEAVAGTPQDHPDLGKRMLLLAKLLLGRSTHTLSTTDLTRSLNFSLDSWHFQLSPPQIRIEAVCFAAGPLASAGMWEEVCPLLEGAVKLLPTASPQYLRRDDHEHILSQFSNLASVAMSAALQLGSSPYHCMSLLELGRGIIMGFTIDCRSDLSVLNATYPDVFETLSRLRTEIDSQTVMKSIQITNDNIRRRRVQALQEIDETLAHIRQLPGLERFQLPPSFEELTEMATEGPIIVFNCTKLRSDAIIVTSAIKSLILPKLKYSEVQERMGQLARVTRGPRSTYSSRNREMEVLLLWLWEVAVEPVLTELRFDAVKDSSMLPRIWWIGVGTLAKAPFHAAGDHSHGSTNNTMSRAMSSYIPTIKALSYAREKKLELRGPHSRLLLISMPTTPDTPAIPEIHATTGTPAIPGTRPVPATSTAAAIQHTHGVPAVYPTIGIPGTPAKKWKPLKNATIEVEAILAAVERVSSIITTRLESPTAARVIEELPTHHTIHFACHGVSDDKNPSNSHLLLSGNSRPAKLTVEMISHMNIKTAQIAYLSACSTGDNASEALADESIHIANGFQLAGFSHVLASMWESNDSACCAVAGEFYRILYDQQRDHGHRAVSNALHHAVTKLRMGLLKQPIKWAPFIHTGA